MQPILDKLKKDGINKIKLGIFDVDGVMRGKYISMKKFASGIENGLGFCDVVFGWDVADELYCQPTITGWHTGYPDAPAIIDVNSYRKIPWEPKTALFIADFQNPDGTPYTACPRQLCKTILQKTADMGFEVKSAFEYEFFLFDETPQTVREKKYENLTPFTPGMFGYSILRNSVHSELYHDFINTCREMDFELEGIHTETGPGSLKPVSALIADLHLLTRLLCLRHSPKYWRSDGSSWQPSWRSGHQTSLAKADICINPCGIRMAALLFMMKTNPII